MKVKLSFFMALLMLMMLMAFSPISRAACIPAPDPDLNNDGIVNSADLVIVSRSNGVAKGNPRYNPLADTNCDGKINPTDIHYVNKAFGQTFPIPPNINVTGVLDGIDSFSFRLGNQAGKSITVRLSSGDGDTPFSVRMTQTIQSATGLVLSPNLTGKELFDDDGDGYINERLGQGMTATIPGEYTITTTATVIGTGKVFTHTAHVKVYGVNEPYVNAVVSSDRQLFLLSGATQQQIQVEVRISGEDAQEVSSVDIKQLENGAIFPAQKQSDKYYDGTVSINTQGLVGGECFNYVALIHTPRGTTQPKYTHRICATTIPIGFNRERRKESAESTTGLIFANNMVIISFKPGTLEPRMKQIAASVNGTLIGQMDVIRFYQIELQSSFPLFQDLDATVAKLKTFPEVDVVGASVKSGSLSSTIFANDPLFQSNLL